MQTSFEGLFMYNITEKIVHGLSMIGHKSRQTANQLSLLVNLCLPASNLIKNKHIIDITSRIIVAPG